jgi:hypothetical protein
MNALRWTEAELEQYMRRGQPARISEKAWQLAVTRLLRQYGYDHIYHTFDSRRSPSGFPDLIAVSETPGKKLLALELKADDGIVRLAQQAWLAALAGCSGVVAEVWRPAMLSEVVERLRG